MLNYSIFLILLLLLLLLQQQQQQPLHYGKSSLPDQEVNQPPKRPEEEVDIVHQKVTDEDVDSQQSEDELGVAEGGRGERAVLGRVHGDIGEHRHRRSEESVGDVSKRNAHDSQHASDVVVCREDVEEVPDELFEHATRDRDVAGTKENGSEETELSGFVVLGELIDQQGEHDKQDGDAEDGAENPADDGACSRIRANEPKHSAENQQKRNSVIDFSLVVDIDVGIESGASGHDVACNEEALLHRFGGVVGGVNGAKRVVEVGLKSGARTTFDADTVPKTSGDEAEHRVDEFHGRVEEVDAVAIAATDGAGLALS